MERKYRIFLLAAGLLCAAGASRAEERRNWQVSSSLNYESGTYGSGARSSSLYVPVTVKRTFGDAFASLTVPHVSQTTDGSVRNVGGRFVKTGRAGGFSAVTTRSGLGDIVLRGGYAVMRDDPRPFGLTAVAKLKAPTADRNQGLGTGEFDAGAGLEAAKLVAPGWMILADLYCAAIGDPPGADLNNQLAADVGFSRLLQEDLTLTVLFEASNALVSGDHAPRDARGILDYRLGEEASIFGGAMVGLSKGSADYGFNLGASVRF